MRACMCGAAHSLGPGSQVGGGDTEEGSVGGEPSTAHLGCVGAVHTCTHLAYGCLLQWSIIGQSPTRSHLGQSMLRSYPYSLCIHQVALLLPCPACTVSWQGCCHRCPGTAWVLPPPVAPSLAPAVLLQVGRKLQPGGSYSRAQGSSSKSWPLSFHSIHLVSEQPAAGGRVGESQLRAGAAQSCGGRSHSASVSPLPGCICAYQHVSPLSLPRATCCPDKCSRGRRGEASGGRGS